MRVENCTRESLNRANAAEKGAKFPTVGCRGQVGYSVVMNCIALDFDGVLCDSAAETGESAWRAGAAVYPEWAGRLVPRACVEEFRRVRPVLETGFEAIPLMRLVSEGVPRDRILREFPALRDRTIAESGVPRSELVELFGTARDRWIAEDPEGWLARHEFYPGVIERMRARMPEDEVYILTTKQERFVRRLLEPVCPEFPDERIFGLDAGICKEDLLVRLEDEHSSSGVSMHFVEDRLDTLVRVMRRPKLAGVHLYLASWGYARTEDIQRASELARVTVWELSDFLALPGQTS